MPLNTEQVFASEQFDSYGVKNEFGAPIDASNQLQQSVQQTGDDLAANAGQSVFELGGTSGQTGQVNVTATATLIKVRNECRRAIKVTNLGVVDVWIGFSPSVSPISGDLLLGTKGSFIVIPVTLDIYAICAAGTSQVVSFMEVSQ